ncbi:MAG TPA: asparagine synthetase B [Cyclobacteriaceae bacterium]|nr:asparagine synthetase B [Cyclobacteriaceae bacterium]
MSPRQLFIVIAFILCTIGARANSLLIVMDGAQLNHLKAYGLAFAVLQKDLEVDWLLNYRGGSFLIDHSPWLESECVVRGVTFERINEGAVNMLLKDIAQPNNNLNIARLSRSPRIAVYSPKNDLVADETDAVITALDYAEIPYTIIYDEEILKDQLARYDWLHLHHEDFTGQHGRFMRRESAVIESKLQEATAHQLGFAHVAAMKLDVAKRIKTFCAGGGYLFAMCSGAETFDIALAAEGIDIVGSEYDGDDSDAHAQEKLDFSKSLAFENFQLEDGRKFSDINTGKPDFFEVSRGYFQVFRFSAKWDLIPTLLTQNHEYVIKEFTGQTSGFNPATIKPSVTILAENRASQNVRYLYGELGKGHWTYYSGHDPEGSPGRRRRSTDLSLYPHSPGYRLILNNVLFPSARKKKQKT